MAFDHDAKRASVGFKFENVADVAQVQGVGSIGYVRGSGQRMLGLANVQCPIANQPNGLRQSAHGFEHGIDRENLLLEQFGDHSGNADLGEAGQEQVGKPVRGHAVQRPVAVGPVIVERQSAASDQRIDAAVAIEVAAGFQAAEYV